MPPGPLQARDKVTAWALPQHQPGSGPLVKTNHVGSAQRTAGMHAGVGADHAWEQDTGRLGHARHAVMLHDGAQDAGVSGQISLRQCCDHAAGAR